MMQEEGTNCYPNDIETRYRENPSTRISLYSRI